MYHSDENINKQVKYVDAILSEDQTSFNEPRGNVYITSTTYVNCSQHSRTSNIMRHLTDGLESVKDFIFQASGGLQSRL